MTCLCSIYFVCTLPLYYLCIFAQNIQQCFVLYRQLTDVILYLYLVVSFLSKQIWCDVHTDGGGFMLAGMKDSPVSWTVPSNSTPVDPQGPPHWSSNLGEKKFWILEFNFRLTKVLKGQRQTGEKSRRRDRLTTRSEFQLKNER